MEELTLERTRGWISAISREDFTDSILEPRSDKEIKNYGKGVHSPWMNARLSEAVHQQDF